MVFEAAESVRFSAVPDAAVIFGCTPAMRDVRTKIDEATNNHLPVLIEGESGTGKEIVARYIHLNSRRVSDPFVRVNCASTPASVLESEIFGSGSGIGDRRKDGRKTGLAETTTSGTLYLDEINEMDLVLQRKLVRALDIQPSADSSEQDIGSRIVCSSSVNLQVAILQGKVPENLIGKFGYRVSLAPLRERKQDIPELCEYLIGKFTRSFSRPAIRLSPTELVRLQKWDWPGNIRELENWIARIVIFGREEMKALDRKKPGTGSEDNGRKHRVMRVPLETRSRSRGRR